MEKEKEWYSIYEIEKMTGIPDRSIRRYIKAHGHRLRIQKEHRSYQIHKAAVPVLKDIRAWYQNNWTRNQIEEELAATGAALTVESGEEDDKKALTLAQALSSIREEVAEGQKEILEKIEQLEDENARKTNTIIQQQQEIIKLTQELKEQKDRSLIDKIFKKKS